MSKYAGVYWNTLTDQDAAQFICREFEIPENTLDGCEIVFAGYDSESYDGWALVIYIKDGKLYEANGSHCSCMGLEGQWEPEETNMTRLLKYNGDFKNDIAPVLIELQARGVQ